MLEKVKMALRIKTDAFDEEIEDMIAAAVADLNIAGVENLYDAGLGGYVPIAIRAIITYCKTNFGDIDDGEYKRLKASYDEQKAQLQTATGYTDWGE